MFVAKTTKIQEIADKQPGSIDELKTLLKGKVAIYIDAANVRPWSEKLEWHIDAKRLKQFLDSFKNVESIKYYQGTLLGNTDSEKEIQDIQKFGYTLRTKPVKIMRQSIDVSSIPMTSDVLLSQFIRRALLRKYRGEVIEYLNREFQAMNKLGDLFIEDRKCNFDVEIGVDMLLEAEKSLADTFVLWSGDSDFADPIEKLIDQGKKVILFATARRVAKELNEMREKGLLIYEISKIRNFICWNRERNDI